MAWCMARAGQGMSPTEIYELAREPVEAAEFAHLSDPAERAAAKMAETDRRSSVREVSKSQISFDIRQARQQVIDENPKAYKPVVEAAIRELRALAFADIRAVVEWGPDGVAVRPSADLTEAEAAMVSKVKIKTTTRTLKDGATEERVEIELESHSKVAALQTLLRQLAGHLDISIEVEAEDAGDVIGRLIDRLERAETT